MTDAPVTSPGVAVPPPVIYVVGFVLGLIIEAAVPTPAPPLPVAVAVGVLGVLIWALLDPAAMRQFAQAGTEVAPSRSASALVTTGPYRWSRNPMYLGMAVLYAALAVAFGVLWALVTLLAVVLLIDRAVITREERYLDVAFDKRYREYRAHVRRWL